MGDGLSVMEIETVSVNVVVTDGVTGGVRIRNVFVSVVVAVRDGSDESDTETDDVKELDREELVEFEEENLKESVTAESVTDRTDRVKSFELLRLWLSLSVIDLDTERSLLRVFD